MFFIQPCVLCGLKVKGRLALCPGCKDDLPWIDSACPGCGLPLPAGAEELHCGECLAGDSPFSHTVIPLHYQKPLKQMLNTFKHHRGLAQGRLLAQLLSDEIRDQYIDHTLPEVIIPVPLHWQRFLWRGYNQSAELGRQLSRELGIPCQTQLLKRIRHTPSQQGLSRKQRLLNLKNAFVIKQALTFQRIALLDDVVTTGTTAMEIARFLRAQGAVEIHLWAIARTPVST